MQQIDKRGSNEVRANKQETVHCLFSLSLSLSLFIDREFEINTRKGSRSSNNAERAIVSNVSATKQDFHPQTPCLSREVDKSGRLRFPPTRIGIAPLRHPLDSFGMHLTSLTQSAQMADAYVYHSDLLCDVHR